MRNFAGLSLPIISDVKAEVGYLNQYSIVAGGRDAIDHVASIAFNYSF